jgi:hypothetical protein
MATSIEIKYFNSFWLKTVNTALAVATWPNGYPYNNATEPLPVLGGGTLAPFPGQATLVVQTQLLLVSQ